MVTGTWICASYMYKVGLTFQKFWDVRLFHGQGLASPTDWKSWELADPIQHVPTKMHHHLKYVARKAANYVALCHQAPPATPHPEGYG